MKIIDIYNFSSCIHKLGKDKVFDLAMDNLSRDLVQFIDNKKQNVRKSHAIYIKDADNILVMDELVCRHKAIKNFTDDEVELGTNFNTNKFNVIMLSGLINRNQIKPILFLSAGRDFKNKVKELFKIDKFPHSKNDIVLHSLKYYNSFMNVDDYKQSIKYYQQIAVNCRHKFTIDNPS